MLVVEDEPTSRRLIERYLERRGVEAVPAESGLEALLKAFAEHIDVVLLDMNLPELSGIEVAERLRRDGFNRPIVAMSASNDEKLIRSWHSTGCSAVLSKPFSREEFERLLAPYLQRVESEEAESAPLLGAGIDDAVQELVREFARKLPERAGIIEREARRQNWKQVIEETHKLRGAGLFGFMRLSRLCGKIEDALRAGKGPVPGSDIFELTSLCRRIASRYD